MPEEILETRGERIVELILPTKDKDIFDQWIEKIAKNKYVKPVIQALSKIKNQFIKLIKLFVKLIQKLLRRKKKTIKENDE